MNQIIAELRKNFFAGILVILPTVVTIFILYWIFARLIGPLVQKVLRPLVLLLVPHCFEWMLEIGGGFLWNILSVIVLVVIIVLLGVLARNIVGKRLIGFGERVLGKLPIISKIYTSARQIANAFLGEKTNAFKEVIIFEYPRAGIYTFGFVSGEAKGEVQDKTHEKVLNVFVPTTPNPTSGLLVLVPKKDTIPVDMTVADALKLLISGGTVTPPVKKNMRKPEQKES